MLAFTVSCGSGCIVPFVSNLEGVWPLVIGAAISLITFITTLFMPPAGSYLPKADMNTSYMNISADKATNVAKKGEPKTSEKTTIEGVMSAIND